jgi:hypothetical protein
VHSCYAGIVNLRTPTGRLVTLQASGPLQAPLALALFGGLETLVPRLSVGALVVQHLPEAAGIPAALRLVCDGAQEWDGRIRPIASLTAPALSQRADALTAWMTQHVPAHGLAPLVTAGHGRAQGLSAVCRHVATALLPLLTGDLSTAAVLDLASRIVGLGEGLTPSGDDLFIGLLAVLQATGYLPSVLPVAAQQQFLRGVTGRTSDLSAEFLRCALEGHFAAPVVRFIRTLFAPEPRGWQASAASLAAVGHSSGVDAMVGIVLGCRLLARQREQPDGQLTFPDRSL